MFCCCPVSQRFPTLARSCIMQVSGLFGLEELGIAFQRFASRACRNRVGSIEPPWVSRRPSDMRLREAETLGPDSLVCIFRRIGMAGSE